MDTEPNEDKKYSSINSGGAYIGEGVNTEGGNLIGRDYHHIENVERLIHLTVFPKYSRPGYRDTHTEQECTKVTLQQAFQDIEQLLKDLMFAKLSNSDAEVESIEASSQKNDPGESSNGAPILVVFLAALLLLQMRTLEYLFLKRRSKLKTL